MCATGNGFEVSKAHVGIKVQALCYSHSAEPVCLPPCSQHDGGGPSNPLRAGTANELSPPKVALVICFARRRHCHSSNWEVTNLARVSHKGAQDNLFFPQCWGPKLRVCVPPDALLDFNVPGPTRAFLTRRLWPPA